MSQEQTRVSEEHFTLVANLIRAREILDLCMKLYPGEDVPKDERRDVIRRVNAWLDRMEPRT